MKKNRRAQGRTGNRRPGRAKEAGPVPSYVEAMDMVEDIFNAVFEFEEAGAPECAESTRVQSEEDYQRDLRAAYLRGQRFGQAQRLEQCQELLRQLKSDEAAQLAIRTAFERGYAQGVEDACEEDTEGYAEEEARRVADYAEEQHGGGRRGLWASMLSEASKLLLTPAAAPEPEEDGETENT